MGYSVMRVGIGYDVHRFGERKPLKLGGITVPSRRGLKGHSDSDVLLHAIADAIFGAIGAPDIGEQFPSDRARYINAKSSLFVKAAHDQLRKQGWTVENLDATIIADAPRLVGFKRKMAKEVSRLLSVDASRISIKAKTTEAFCPSKDGIAAQAVVLLKDANGSNVGARRKDSTLDRRSRLRLR